MTPAAAVAMLDRQMKRHGQDATLRRIVPNAAALDVPVRIAARGYEPDELVSNIRQGDSVVVLSPSSLAGTVFVADLPASGDKVIYDGRTRTVQMAEPVRINGELVRVNLQVRG